MYEFLLDNTKDQEYHRAVPIIAFDDGLETLLPCSIPNLQFNVELVVDFYDLRSELNTLVTFILPTVTVCSLRKVSFVYLVRRQLLPDPDIPTKMTLNCAS